MFLSSTLNPKLVPSNLWLRAGVAMPFYDAVNSFMNGIFSPLLTYTLPCGIFWLHYRKEENRKRISYPHMR